MNNNIKDPLILYTSFQELENDRIILSEKFGNCMQKITYDTTPALGLYQIFKDCLQEIRKYYKELISESEAVSFNSDELIHIFFESCLYNALATFNHFEYGHRIINAYDAYKYYFTHGNPPTKASFLFKETVYLNNDKYLKYALSYKPLSNENFSKTFNRMRTKSISTNDNFINFQYLNTKTPFFTMANLNFSLYFLDSFYSDAADLRKLYKYSSLLSKRLNNNEKMSSSLEILESDFLDVRNKQMHEEYSAEHNKFDQTLANIIECNPAYSHLILNAFANVQYDNFVYEIKTLPLKKEDTATLKKLYRLHTKLTSRKMIIPKDDNPHYEEFNSAQKSYQRSKYNVHDKLIEFFTHYYFAYYSRIYHEQRTKNTITLNNSDYLLSQLKCNLLFAPDIFDYTISNQEIFIDYKVSTYLQMLQSISIPFARDKILDILLLKHNNNAITFIFKKLYPLLARIFFIKTYDYYSYSSNTNDTNLNSLNFCDTFCSDIQCALKKTYKEGALFTPNQKYTFLTEIEHCIRSYNEEFIWNKNIYSESFRNNLDDESRRQFTNILNSNVYSWKIKGAKNPYLPAQLDEYLFNKNKFTSSTVHNTSLFKEYKHAYQINLYSDLITSIWSSQSPSVSSLHEILVQP